MGVLAEVALVWLDIIEKIVDIVVIKINAIRVKEVHCIEE